MLRRSRSRPCGGRPATRCSSRPTILKVGWTNSVVNWVYVWVDGQLFNLEMIKVGFAHEYTYDAHEGVVMGWLVKSALSDKKHSQIVTDAQQALLPGETILDATGGMVDVHRHGGKQARRGSLVVTDQRVFLFTKRVGGFDVQDFAYGMLTGCNYSTGAGFSTIELVAAGDRTMVSQVLKDEAKRIGPLIRNQMAVAVSPTSRQHAEQPGAAEQLATLDQLRSTNLITEEEFGTKRAAILDRL